MNKKIIIGLSGGVDSTVSIKLLKDKDYDVEALFMKNWNNDEKTDGCNVLEDLEYAIDACEKLDVKLHTANFSEQYWNNIFFRFY